MREHGAVLLLSGVLAGCYASSPPGSAPDAGSTPDAPGSRCGNGRLDPGETCDDGNEEDCDGCSAACRSETALYIDRVMPGASVPLESSPCLNCPFTVEAWFRFDTPGATVPIVYQEWLLELWVTDEGAFMYCPRGGGSASVIDDLEIGVWHHVVGTCFWDEEDGGWWTTAYIDGRTFGALRGIGPFAWECDQPLLIGHAHSHTHGEPLPPSLAVIDDVRLSSEALYEFGGDDFPAERNLTVRPDTVAFYDFDGVDDGIVRDVSGNGHDAFVEHGMLVPDGCHMP